MPVIAKFCSSTDEVMSAGRLLSEVQFLSEVRSPRSEVSYAGYFSIITLLVYPGLNLESLASGMNPILPSENPAYETSDLGLRTADGDLIVRNQFQPSVGVLAQESTTCPASP